MDTKFEDLSKQQEQKVKALENNIELFEKQVDKVKEIEEKQNNLIEEAKTKYRCVSSVLTTKKDYKFTRKNASVLLL